ncbi:flavohemoglobin expression-modulating QEGLA motif protein [soil metagenome]
MRAVAMDSLPIERILRGYRTDAHVRERLPGGGTLNIDRKLPFIFVYRQPPGQADEGTAYLIAGEASYLIATGAADEDVTGIVAALADVATSELGSFLVLEIWAGDRDSREFVLNAPASVAASTVAALHEGLHALGATPLDTRVESRTTDSRHPAELPPLLNVHECWETGSLLLGLEVPPLYRNDDDTVYPVFVRRMRTLLSPVLRQTAYEFARVHTTAGFESYRALGPRRFDDDVFHIDRELAAIETTYDFLLLVSPLNARQAWRRFRDRRYDREPEFHYRLLPVDPDLLKRRLYNLELDHVADPAMAFLLRDKRDELDREITMLAERNTADFRHSSIRLYKEVDDVLLDVAVEILRQVQPDFEESDEGPVLAADFAALARAEIRHYREAYPDIAAEVQIRPDLVGLMVSRGNLLIGESLSLRPARVDALLHHEVGTHVLTFYNGRAQPLRQLSTGLAGYDELQEGLAVFAEYLADGLDGIRLRTLAARVVAGHCVEHGASFIDTFRLLHHEHNFTASTAFDITERVHASGGFTRDIIYLRGLIRLLEYLRAGGEIEPLYTGKLAEKHIGIIGELREREFLVEPPLVPRVLQQRDTPRRMEAVRQGLTLTGMIRGA